MDDPTLRPQLPRTVFQFESTEAEALAALEFNQTRLGRRLRRSAAIHALGIVAGVACLGLIYLVALLVIERDRSRLWVVAGFAGLSTLLALSRVALQRSMFRMIAAGSDSLKGKRTVRIEAEVLRSCGPDGETAVCWSGIRSIEELSRQILIYVDDFSFLLIPSSAFVDAAEQVFYPMRLKPVDPRRLKELLDQSGIRRRVVVVSTCYSGAFVDALKDDSTLVIAASAGDKSSFGCSNDADFTYFGKAYFDEALRRTDSFSDAFEMARTAIAERERKANLPSSDPQMFVGKGIKRALEKFVSFRQAAMLNASARGSRR